MPTQLIGLLLFLLTIASGLIFDLLINPWNDSKNNPTKYSWRNYFEDKN